ncbi:hypothetical protein C8Q75DRAFT_809384 [Abortiporus biennis]|nr:hypothetical protein C8Q75DRAFT_809384 [Abortiporus biennis]
MPSLLSLSSYKAQNEIYNLVLKAQHCLLYGSPSDKVVKIKTQIPSIIQIIQFADIIFRFSGQYNGAMVSSNVMKESALATIFLGALRSVSGKAEKPPVYSNGLPQYSNHLGILHISEVFIEDDTLVNFTVSTLHCLEFKPLVPPLKLVSIHLSFVIKSVNNPSIMTESDPFTGEAYLPLQTVLDPALEKFMDSLLSLCRRYPLVFGALPKVRLTAAANGLIPSCNVQTLNREAPLCRVATRAILNMISRSPHSDFCVQSRKAIKKLRKRRRKQVATISEALSELFGVGFEDILDSFPTQESTDEDTMVSSMLDILRAHFKLRILKMSAQNTEGAEEHLIQDDDEASSEQLSSFSEHVSLFNDVEDGSDDLDCYLGDDTWSDLELEDNFEDENPEPIIDDELPLYPYPEDEDLLFEEDMLEPESSPSSPLLTPAHSIEVFVKENVCSTYDQLHFDLLDSFVDSDEDDAEEFVLFD